MYGSSSHLWSAYDNVRKYIGIHGCLTIANTSNKNRFQYASVPLTQLINENALSFATNLAIILLKLLLLAPAVNLPGLILCIPNFIDDGKWCYSYTDLVKRYDVLMMQNTN